MVQGRIQEFHSIVFNYVFTKTLNVGYQTTFFLVHKSNKKNVYSNLYSEFEKKILKYQMMK